jgi:hypothetical protein
MRITRSRAIATAAAALIALITISLQPAAAGWRHNDDAALTAFGLVLGTIAGVIAAEHDRDQPAYAPTYPYDHDHDAYAHGWHHRAPIHDFMSTDGVTTSDNERVSPREQSIW